MPSPFPGMDPYLETPDLWPDVHHALISEIRTALNPVLRPHYVARIELRVYISDEDDPGREVIVPDIRVERGPKRKRGRKQKRTNTVAIAEPITIPLLIDDEIKEARLEIRHRASHSLVTIIEVLSPTNKIRGSRGRVSFMEKRRETLSSNVHWVEIDLLRAGEPSVRRLRLRPCHYRLLVSRADERSKARFWPVSIRQALPTIGIPLRGKDPDVPLDLNAVLAAAYDHAAYDLSIDYHREPDPPLDRDDRAWADRLLRARGFR
jgi:hypothetical protein